MEAQRMLARAGDGGAGERYGLAYAPTLYAPTRGQDQRAVWTSLCCYACARQCPAVSGTDVAYDARRKKGRYVFGEWKSLRLEKKGEAAFATGDLVGSRVPETALRAQFAARNRRRAPLVGVQCRCEVRCKTRCFGCKRLCGIG
eukprot:3941321-Rhodomonas_salina.2